ncbi:MAG: hypothetical protein PHW69_09500, partial [Elusimicrobiaceae bacterium]|nr:hypothetical protein [Elusimicrobiaceae bacterium]
GLSEVEEDSFIGFDLNEMLKLYAQPEFFCDPVTMTVTHAGTEKKVFVVQVPGGTGYPAVCANDAQADNIKVLENGAVYTRSNDGKSEKVTSFLQMKAVLDRATSDRLTTEEAEKNSDEKSLEEISDSESFFNVHGAFDSWSFWEIICYPALYQPKRLALPQANRLFDDAAANPDGFWFFSPHKFDSFSKGSQFFMLSPDKLECGRIYQSGVFAWRRAVPEDYGATKFLTEDKKKALSLENAVNLITQAVMFAGAFYQSLGLECDLNFQIYLRKTENRRLVSKSPFYSVPETAVCREETASVLRRVRAGDLELVRKNSIEAARDLVSMFNWHDEKQALPSIIRISEAMCRKQLKVMPKWLKENHS